MWRSALSVVLILLAACWSGRITGAGRQQKDGAAADKNAAHPERAREFEGVFDPYACSDESIKDRVVMKERPDCTSCHARATLEVQAGVPVLHLVVNHGSTDAQWRMKGRLEGETIIFTKEKMQVSLEGHRLTGRFDGRLQATISLTESSADGTGPAKH